MRALAIAVTGAAVALSAVALWDAHSNGSDTSSTPPASAAAESSVGWLGAVPYCVLFLRWTENHSSLTGVAQAVDTRKHLSWSLPARGSVSGSAIKIDVPAPGLCSSHGRTLRGSASGDGMLFRFGQPNSTPLSITFQKAGVADFEAASAARAEITSASPPAPPSLLSTLAEIPAGVFTRVGRGTATQPAKLSASLLAAPDGRPRVVWIGAEYCASCAAVRWPLVVALERFGSFTGLRATTSTALDGYPNTKSFSFFDSTYTSPYLTFESVERSSNIPAGSGFVPLESPTAEQQDLMDKFDQPPYVDPSSRNALPFVDFANNYSIAGVTFSPAILRGLTANDIAVSLFDPKTPVAKAVIGSANEITAALCVLTDGQPVTICSEPVVKAIQAQLG